MNKTSVPSGVTRVVTRALAGLSARFSGSAGSADDSVTMNQLVTEIRRADKVYTSPSNDTVIVERDPDLRMTEEESREFKYDAMGKLVTLQVYYKKPDGTTYRSPLYTMCRNVTECRFGPPAKDNAGIELRVPVTVVVKTGGNTIRLSDTSGPRRAM